MSKPITPKAPPSFAALVHSFFNEHLTQQRSVSPCTVASYRDAFVLFLDFATGYLHKQPTAIGLDDLTPTLILAFLDHLERDRGNAVRTRNARLAMLRTFLKYAGHRDVGALGVIEQALGVPMKRFERAILGFLSPEEMVAIIGKPGATWTNRRDHLLWQMLYNTGARVSEIIGVCVSDVLLDGVACVHLRGKGRKQRTMPLWRSTTKVVRTWLKFNPELSPASPLLPNREGHQMTRTNVAQRLALAVSAATPGLPSLGDRRISPHTIRHTTAMHLLQAGESIEAIALWLGHESPTTTHQYTQANLAMKERTLAKLKDPATQAGRFRASDSLLDFLKKL
jgi:integrase/recombinase XerD